MKKHTFFLILILITMFITSCMYDFIVPVEVPPIDNTKPTLFSADIVPIFADKCISCHDKQAPVLTADVAYMQIMLKDVNTASPASSKLYVNASSGNHYAKVTALQAQLILKWITEGALKN